MKSFRPSEVLKWHRVTSGKQENFLTIAKFYGIPVRRLIAFNFPGSVENGRILPAVVNWYLHHHIGFGGGSLTHDHLNHMFKGGEEVAIPFAGEVEEGEVIVGKSELTDQLAAVERKIAQLKKDMKKPEQEAKSATIGAIPIVGNYAAAAYDFATGNVGEGMTNLAEEGAEKSLHNLKILPPLVSEAKDAYEMHTKMSAYGALVKKLDELMYERYKLMDKLGDPNARYNLPGGKYYYGTGNKLHSQRTGLPVDP